MRPDLWHEALAEQAVAAETRVVVRVQEAARPRLSLAPPQLD